MKIFYNATHRFFVKPDTHYDQEAWRSRRCAETGILRMNVIDKFSRSRAVFLKEIAKGNLAVVGGAESKNPFQKSPQPKVEDAAALVSEGKQSDVEIGPTQRPRNPRRPKRPRK